MSTAFTGGIFLPNMVKREQYISDSSGDSIREYGEIFPVFEGQMMDAGHWKSLASKNRMERGRSCGFLVFIICPECVSIFQAVERKRRTVCKNARFIGDCRLNPLDGVLAQRLS